MYTDVILNRAEQLCYPYYDISQTLLPDETFLAMIAMLFQKTIESTAICLTIAGSLHAQE
ncbi:hypothetical protein Pr1d_25300 [Bythopirellula goksoeyrii]|uniref:Uncharacterized protein n=1 Tax=Bythopirellula goksoeyrii TaxID=1400387 RepID=A0A5B9QEA4_9BACT|nr:hypothetical protein Pr1d_25300 [Bythopirellula goksoeyrii]